MNLTVFILKPIERIRPISSWFISISTMIMVRILFYFMKPLSHSMRLTRMWILWTMKG